jgi:hypothetical protein
MFAAQNLALIVDTVEHSNHVPHCLQQAHRALAVTVTVAAQRVVIPAVDALKIAALLTVVTADAVFLL